MASATEDTEILNYQTSVLKVSIHCEGCKKKVRKILQRLEGVYAIDIDSKQNKVTVTGNVDAESLIRRLAKYGKHADLWPEKKRTGDAETDVAATVLAAKTEQQLPKTEKQQQSEEDENSASKLGQESNVQQPNSQKAAAESDSQKTQPPQTDPKSDINASKSNDNDKQADTDTKDSLKPSAALEAGTSEEIDDTKKGEKADIRTTSIDERAVLESDMVNKSGADGAIPSPPEQFFVYAQPPVYTVSYSAAQPSTSYAYYTSSPGATPSSYAYSSYPPLSAQPPENYSSDSYYGSMEAPAATEGSYHMFNDENPNACNLM